MKQRYFSISHERNWVQNQKVHTDSWGQFGKLGVSAGFDVEEPALCKKSPMNISICKMDT